MLFTKALLTLAAVSSAVAGPILLDKRQGSIRGVNLGGWLVLEPWITPSIFDQYGGAVVDEYTLGYQSNAQSVLQSHWASWVTLGDFQRIAGSGKGINLVRIPIGYWSFQKYGNDPYVQGAKDYLAQALNWASQTGLQVWIDLHGAPLSQNGFDNSGQRTNSPQFTAGNTVSFMTGIISQVVAEFGSHPAVTGIELLNEPLMSNLPGGRGAITSFYQQGSAAVNSNSSKTVVIQDGFASPSSWSGQFSGAILDHHEYQVFTQADVALSYSDHASQAYSRAAQWASGSGHFLVCGEWTAAMTDCARYLNGYGIGARYDGSYNKNGETSYYVGSCAGKSDISSWDQALRDGTRNYIQAQINAFNQNTNGWIFWNFKTESAAEWDFFRLVDAGIWP